MNVKVGGIEVAVGGTGVEVAENVRVAVAATKVRVDVALGGGTSVGTVVAVKVGVGVEVSTKTVGGGGFGPLVGVADGIGSEGVRVAVAVVAVITAPAVGETPVLGAVGESLRQAELDKTNVTTTRENSPPLGFRRPAPFLDALIAFDSPPPIRHRGISEVLPVSCQSRTTCASNGSSPLYVLVDVQALVLSGGSIKGCYQAGAVAALFASSRAFQPSFVAGISVGALNGAFLVDRAGRAWRNGQMPDWASIGAELARFWRENIRSFSDLGHKRGCLSLVWSIATNDFDGLTSMDALDLLVRREVDPRNLRAAGDRGLRFEAGTVNLRDGAYLAADASHPRILGLILASSALPIVMPARRLDSGVWLDGGVRNVTPLKSAIDAGANTIVCVVCQQRGLLPDPAFDPGRLIVLADRISDVVEQTILDNDLLVAAKKNRLVAEFGHTELVASKRWRKLDIRVIRPAAPLPINLESFTSADIERGIEQGFADAGGLP